MAVALIEITLPGLTGFTLTLDLYPHVNPPSDTAAVTGLTLTEATNRKCTYTTSTTAALSGIHLAIAKEGSTVRGEGYVKMDDTTANHVVKGSPDAANVDATAVNAILTATGLDAITLTEPTGVPTTFVGWFMWLVRRFAPKAPSGSVTMPKSGNGNMVVKGSTGAAITTQPVTDDSVTQTLGPVS